MYQDTSLFFLWLALTVASFWLIPPSAPRWRQSLLIVSSFLLIFAVAPFAALLVLWMWATVWIAIRAFERSRTPLVLCLFLIATCAPLLWQRTVVLDAGLIVTLGITFATLRAVAMAMDSYTRRAVVPALDAGVCLFFLPLYTVGPIESVQKFTSSSFTSTPDYAFMARGLSRMALGLFKTVFIAEQIIAGALRQNYPAWSRNFSDYSSPEIVVFVCLSFLYTYINFSGVVDIALGASRLFGLSIIENFNYPILARNMRDFWRRWHISLGRWITQYLYFPIVAKLHTPTAPYIATFVAFMLIGWWHGSTLTYISWGVLHGTGLCTVMAWQRAMKRNYPAAYKVMVGNPVYIGLSWMATLFYVAWVQTFANQKSFGEALVMTRSLIGL
jgi:alginate O-acetyltransferase complex protein AlgI